MDEEIQDAQNKKTAEGEEELTEIEREII